MRVTRTILDCRTARLELGSVVLVPTMGALHDGHVMLMKAARAYGEHVAVSIFVNPTQFGPKEDFNRYPRPIEADLEKCRDAGVALVFNPPPEEMYREGQPPAVVDLPSLTEVLEGKHRPGHFRGVCQVVAKLMNIVQPNSAVFGLKDYQQFRVLSAMVDALDFPIRMIGHPTVRDADGLAMSSRNAYLSPDERRRALSISRALFRAREQYEEGVRQTGRLVATMTHMLLDPGELGRVHVAIEYVTAVDAQTLRPIEQIDRPTVLAVAARVGNTRLIDNVLLQGEPA